MNQNFMTEIGERTVINSDHGFVTIRNTSKGYNIELVVRDAATAVRLADAATQAARYLHASENR